MSKLYQIDIEFVSTMWPYSEDKPGRPVQGVLNCLTNELRNECMDLIGKGKEIEPGKIILKYKIGKDVDIDEL